MSAFNRPRDADPFNKNNNFRWKITPMEDTDCVDIAGWIAALSLSRKLEAPLIAEQLRQELGQARKIRYPDFFVVFKDEEKIAFLTGRLSAQKIAPKRSSGKDTQVLSGRDYKIDLLLNPFAPWEEDTPAEERFKSVVNEVLPFIFFNPLVGRILTVLRETDAVRKKVLEELGFEQSDPIPPLKNNQYWYACPRPVYL